MNARNRNDLAAAARWLVANKQHLTYQESRPVPWLGKRWPAVMDALRSGETFASDCSGTLIGLFAWLGLGDPSGEQFNGSGNTQSFLSHLPRSRTPHRGAIGVFGGDLSRQHAVMLLDEVYESPANLCFSFGQASGPFALPLENEISAHLGQPFTWLSVASL